LREAMATANLELLALVPGPNFLHLTGLQFHLSEVKEQRAESALGRLACRRGTGRSAADYGQVDNVHNRATCTC